MKNTVLLLLLIATLSTQAQDRLFTYTYQSTVLNQGQKEIEVWNTIRTGRKDFYLRYDHRTEFEIGLGHNLQTAFYLNATTKSQTAIDNGSKQLETENEISFSNEWKLKLLDPVANPVGLALYGEYGIGSKEFELEGKLLIDKKINNLTFATNAVYELELEPEYEGPELEWEKEHKVDVHLAAAYSFTPKFHLTMENVCKNVFEEGELEHSALYSGLGTSYIGDRYWINCTVLPQIAAFKGNEQGERLNLHEFEKVQFRVLFSYVL